MSVGLVLEGGGMRGAYTAGVLEAFMEENIDFKYVIGVSAGALTAMSFVSKQRKRNFKTLIEHAPKAEYSSVANLAKTGNLFNFDYILGDIMLDILPFDFDAFHNSETQFLTNATNIETGRPVYFSKKDLLNDPKLDILRATSSLPFIAKIVEFGGMQLLDGGCCDPIPIEKSLSDGNEYNVIVLTQNSGYIKEKTGNRTALRAAYSEYPEFVEVMMNRHEIYNRQVRLCEELEQQGKAIIIRPINTPNVDTHEKNREKLAALHDTGAFEVFPKLQKIRNMLENHS